jgi:hypothetical protein
MECYGKYSSVTIKSPTSGFTISTKSQTLVNVRVEVIMGTLNNENGYAISLDAKDSGIQFYKVQSGIPVTISIGGTLNITPENKNYQGNYQGSISITGVIYGE